MGGIQHSGGAQDPAAWQESGFPPSAPTLAHVLHQLAVAASSMHPCSGRYRQPWQGAGLAHGLPGISLPELERVQDAGGARLASAARPTKE